MQPMSLVRAAVQRFIFLAPWCVLASPVGHAQFMEGPPQPNPTVPAVILNEVLFDQTGADDQSAFGSEWVELYARNSVNLADYRLESASGAVLGTLPSVQVPAGTYVLVILGGLDAYLLDEDPSDGTFSLTLGLPPGDVLPNAQVPGDAGGVRLRRIGGAVLDRLYWGHGAPPAGWNGEYFDLSFVDGRPMNEADSIGRSANPVADYTGTLADWDRNGGRNAAGPTPNHRNVIDVVDEASILKWAQAGVCGLVNSFTYMAGQNNKYRFLDASVSDVDVVDQNGTLTVTATHTFDVSVAGVQTTLSGDLVTTLVRQSTPGAVQFTQTASGSLDSPLGWGIDLDHSRTIQGFHTNALTATTQTDVIWHEAGGSYPFSCSVTKTLERTGDHVWELTDSRTGVDYGGAGPKYSSATATYTRTADGALSTLFDLERDMPIGPPKPGQSQTVDYVQRVVIETQSTGDDLGAHTTVVTRYDEYRNGQIEATLRAGQTGLASLAFEGASEDEPLGSANFLLDLPLLIDGVPRTMTIAVRGEVSQEDGYYLGQAEGQLGVSGLLSNSFAIFADPPQGSGGGSSSGSEGGGFGDAAVNCATKGGAIGAGVGAVGGGVAGAIGGGAVGSAVGALGGPPGAVAAATAGGVKGAAVGTGIGAAAGAVAGGGVGSAVCMGAYGAKKAWGGIKAAWNWIFD